MCCDDINGLKIKVKKLHPDAVLPAIANDTDAGYDLVAVDDGECKYEKNVLAYRQYKTGLAIEPPVGYHTEIIPRSSITKYGLILKNSLGLIDYSYRGEICFRFQQIFPMVYDIEFEWYNPQDASLTFKEYLEGWRFLTTQEHEAAVSWYCSDMKGEKPVICGNCEGYHSESCKWIPEFDSGLRSNITYRIKDDTLTPTYKKGDKIGQLLIRKTIHMPFEFVDELGSTARGTGGFGSTGK